MDAKWWWILGMLGPFGALGLIRSAATSYKEWRAPKEIELGFASTEKVEALETVLRDFFPRVIGFDRDNCLITDESSLFDFTRNEEEHAELRERLNAVYGIDVHTLPDDRLVTIAAAIDAVRRLSISPHAAPQV